MRRIDLRQWWSFQHPPEELRTQLREDASGIILSAIRRSGRLKEVHEATAQFKFQRTFLENPPSISQGAKLYLELWS
ncbi:hypothetical protein JHK87_024226 [Glycine soja]|nr:hypothetical protein JHK87_024226 [Glycine soja]